VQNEMIAAILGKNLVIDPASPPPRFAAFDIEAAVP
jgi:hypothetical protein